MIAKITQAEIDEKAAIFYNKIAYSSPVHVGFWHDELAAQEENQRVVAYKKDRCQLLIQKTRKMLRNILKATELTLENPFVLYGVNYQIKSSRIKNYNGKEMYLAGSINERDIEHVQHFVNGCDITGTPMGESVVRNTFRIIPGEPDRYGGQVLFGEDVFLQISESCGPPLYVQFQNTNVATFGEELTAKLSQDADIYCRFKFFHGDPSMRRRTLGGNFMPLTPLIIQHTASGQNLSMESKRWVQTFYGPEMEVSCHTYRDCHKNDGPENFWDLVSKPDLDLDD